MAQSRPCEHPGCSHTGEYRAPHSPQRLHQFRWFCLEHVRAYNKNWDFARGLDPGDIERIIRFDTIWQRETRPLGNWSARDRLLRRRAQAFAEGHEPSAAPAASAGYDPKVAAALAMLELDVPPPTDLLQVKYRELVKRYHPDANGGDRAAEERLKDINLAYAVLREYLR